MGNSLEALLDINKPLPPDPSLHKECEDCNQFTNNVSIAWPKENFYRYICMVCRSKRREEQLAELKL